MTLINKSIWLTIGLLTLEGVSAEDNYVRNGFDIAPYKYQVTQKVAQLKSPDEKVRSTAVEALGFLRDFSSADSLVPMLKDESALVRREAVMALGWCGNRKHLTALLRVLKDDEWSVRQGAAIALSNLTAMDFPFNSMGTDEEREPQVATWNKWVTSLKDYEVPQDVLTLTVNHHNPNLALRKKSHSEATFSTTGSSLRNLTNGEREREVWLSVSGYPQHVSIDLKRKSFFSCVIIHQPEIQKAMTDFAIEVSDDGKKYRQVHRQKSSGKKEEVVNFPRVEGRYVRLISYDSLDPKHAAAIYEIEVYSEQPYTYHTERALRALGTLGGRGASLVVCSVLKPYLDDDGYILEPDRKAVVQAGIRALGRLKEEVGYQMLLKFLDKNQFTHYVAEALADFGDRRAVGEILKRFADHSMGLKRQGPKTYSPWDKPGLSPIDRMYMVPFAFATALTRLPLDKPEDMAKLKEIVPYIVANIPSDYDGLVIYEPQAWQLVFAYLLEKAGARQMVVDIALAELGVNGIKVPASDEAEAVKVLAIHHERSSGHYNDCPVASAWLPALCRSKKDIPSLIKLLNHEDGWVRIAAIKALMFIGGEQVKGPILDLLAKSKREADYGVYGDFKFYNRQPDGQSEFNDPGPRWREAAVMALGNLKELKAVPLLIKLVSDDKNAVEIQYAAAKSLGMIGSDVAMTALQQIEANHPVHSVKLMARESLWLRNIQILEKEVPMPSEQKYVAEASEGSTDGKLEAIVFIRGDKHTENSYQMDNWRQLYGTTDSGPTYRHGKNLYKLAPATKDGKVTALTKFKDGFVADCEVSPDGKKVIFCKRGQEDPWWHLYEINVDGSGLKQLTKGPYHDVQPNYLSDGRIVFSTTRIGLRDEYHGYPATGLAVMNEDASDIHCISFNLGRDAEPVVLEDGRIGFSRLELFYARMKTEWNAQTIYPDGTHNTVIYGPEWRQFWHRYTKGEGIGWVCTGLRHRTLRVSQLQPFGRDKVLGITQKGLTVIGPGRQQQSFVPHDQMMVVTTPFPLKDGRVLCAAGKKSYHVDKKGKVRKTNRIPTDLGIYWVNTETGKLELLYNDLNFADFEPRPVMKRSMPAMPMGGPFTRMRGFTGKLLCSNAMLSMERRVTERGRYVRIIEGQPHIARHQTHTAGGVAWKNHTGTHARVLGTAPLAPDGSFFVEIPADRFIHIQILDADRRVVGNEAVWHYSRPGEVKSCIGCHEKPDMAPKGSVFTMASRHPVMKFLPYGGEFSYHAKQWTKGHLPDESEERVRTIRAVNLLGRQ